jgi:hypothetical protein
MAFKLPFGVAERYSIGVGAVLVICAVIGLATPGSAIARIGKCKGSITGADESRLLEAARNVLPPNTEPVVANVCPMAKGMSAEITTLRIPDNPGTTHWWVTSCMREDREWMCGPVEFEREIEQRLVVDGIERHVAITIDKDTPLESAKSLVTRAIRLYADPASQVPYCGGIVESESRWRLLREHHPLPNGEARIPVAVTQQVTMGIVLFNEVIQPDDVKIRIQVRIEGPNSANMVLPCYGAIAP